MSGQLTLWDDGATGSQKRPPAEAIRASIARELRYLLTISDDAGKPFHIRPAGVAHSVGVCLIEDSNMARGKGTGKQATGQGNMPRFVDVKLTAEQRDHFTNWSGRDGDLVTFLQSMADDGYRVGVSWSGEQQAYTVSLTCRDDGNPNNGLCMTSFARTLSTALWLALFKHLVVTEERWVEGAFGGGEDFG